MGRTFRCRSRKKCRPVNLSSDPSFVQLTRWMSKNGWSQLCSLRLAKFVDTGRGLMALNNVSKGDVIVSIPKHLLITTATVSTSSFGQILSSCKGAKNCNFLCQELLVWFLVWERHLGNDSSWSEYVSTLPSSFSTPITLDECHFNSFPWFLQEQAAGMLELVQNCFSHLMAMIDSIRCSHCQQLAADIFKWDDFLWGWCCVNTRAVFIEPESVPSHSIPIKDRNCLALAPYLDMFNHSDNAKVKVGLNISNGCYEITTLQPFSKFKEVFINYGPHSNSKLFLEYGFILPSTIHDIVPLKFSHLIDAFKLVGKRIEYEYEKTKFCQNHELITQLYVSRSGLSWNCLTLLKILLSNCHQTKTWEQISFMGDKSSSGDIDFEKAKRATLEILEKDIINSQNLVFGKCSGACCTAVNNCNGTLNLFLALLKNFRSIIKISKGVVRRVSFFDLSSCDNIC
ncbi:SET domain-containing protein 4 [Thrips palmi]|uniref:SET domain-containing protein 4 n=1 Tax=Thrips palmi TaxID=161013 RepID=A0A6P8ZIM8_THRPL|nr:SET domain-containing protein 4 [Thrips palmi]